MRPEPTVLVMAGAREAHGIVAGLLARRRRVIASLPGPERMFGPLPVPTRVGEFDSAAHFSDWLSEHHVATVIDASHTFDQEISRMVAAVAVRRDLRYLRVMRPPWTQTLKDNWLVVKSVSQAARSVPDHAVVFTNTGRGTLDDFADFAGKRLYMRLTQDSPDPPPFDFVEFVTGTPPFSQFDEEALFRRLGISHMICRNTGGAASMSKVLAARALALPVVMVARQPVPKHLKVVETVAEALAWEADG